MKGTLKNALFIALTLLIASTSVHASQPISPKAQARIADATFVDISGEPAAPILQTGSALQNAYAIIAPAVKADASTFAAKGSKVAQAAQAKAHGWFQATKDGLSSTKESIINSHKNAESRTAAFGQWIADNPNKTMGVAAAIVLGYVVYKVRKMYLAYKRGSQTFNATVTINK